MAVGDVYSMQIEALVDANYVQNSLHFKVATDPGLTPLATATDLCTGWLTTFKTLWLALFATDYTLLGLTAKRVFPTGGPSTIVATGSSFGTVTGVSDASIMGGLVEAVYQDPVSTKWRSLRIFLPAAPQTFISSSAISSAYTTAMNAFATPCASTFAGAGSGRYLFCGFKRKPTPQIINLASMRVSTHIGIQRRRERPRL